MVLYWIQILSLAYLPPTVRFREQTTLAQVYLTWVCCTLQVAKEHLCVAFFLILLLIANAGDLKENLEAISS